MAEYRLSLSAEKDIANIADYTIEKFGLNQARLYRNGLISSFKDISNRPERGRLYFHGKQKLVQRYRYKAHMIFYKRTNYGILIIRILGGRMDFDRHL